MDEIFAMAVPAWLRASVLHHVEEASGEYMA